MREPVIRRFVRCYLALEGRAGAPRPSYTGGEARRLGRPRRGLDHTLAKKIDLDLDLERLLERYFGDERG